MQLADHVRWQQVFVALAEDIRAIAGEKLRAALIDKMQPQVFVVNQEGIRHAVQRQSQQRLARFDLIEQALIGEISRCTPTMPVILPRVSRIGA